MGVSYMSAQEVDYPNFEIDNYIREILKDPDKYEEEAKLIITLEKWYVSIPFWDYLFDSSNRPRNSRIFCTETQSFQFPSGIIYLIHKNNKGTRKPEICKSIRFNSLLSI